MIEGTLNDCRRAAELAIAIAAAIHGYTPVNVEEKRKEGLFRAVWDAPDGKMMCEYQPSDPDSDAPPLHVSEALLEERRSMRQRTQEAEKQLDAG